MNTLAKKCLMPLIAACLMVALAPLTFFASAETACAAIADENLVDPTQRADNSFIYDTTIESLFDQASLYDDRTVQVVGEVIGDRIAAERETCWITLTVIDAEDKSSISVLMSDDQASQIDHYGKYGVTGTILQVRGTYHQSCDEHAGLPDVHATEVSVMSKGVETPDQLEPGMFAPGLFAVLIGIMSMVAFYFARERMR